MLSELEFSAKDITFSFTNDRPYELRYHAYGNTYGSRVEGELSYKQVKKLIKNLEDASLYMKRTITFKDVEFTEEDIKELTELFEQKNPVIPF